MVHNGIEYGDMQLICEAYWLLKHVLGLSNEELYDVFAEWNKGELDSYLIEITRDIFSVKDGETGSDLVDLVLDTAGAKGTGKWMSQLALDLGTPSSLVTTAVYARSLSAQKDARVRASSQLGGPTAEGYTGDKADFVEPFARPCMPRRSAATPRDTSKCKLPPRNMDWPLNFGPIALLWRGGCIIRAVFLQRIKEAFDADPNLENLLLTPTSRRRWTTRSRRGERGRRGRQPRHFDSRVRDRTGLLRRLPQRSVAGESLAVPNATTSEPTPITASTSPARAPSTPTGFASASNPSRKTSRPK
jgi:6-phosphogluconate dehydrogenase (decarboxylating)